MGNITLLTRLLCLFVTIITFVPFSRILADSGAGSDIAPAVHAALDLAERGPSAADIVLVGDFHFPTLALRTMTRVGDPQERMEHRIHALTIHRMPIQDPLNIFDFRWHFNTGHSGSQGIAADSFRVF